MTTTLAQDLGYEQDPGYEDLGYGSTLTSADLGYGDDDFGYGATPTVQDLGYGAEDLGYGATPTTQDLGYGGEDLGYGDEEPAAEPRRAGGARRRCSVTKYSLEASAAVQNQDFAQPDTAQTTESRPHQPVSQHLRIEVPASCLSLESGTEDTDSEYSVNYNSEPELKSECESVGTSSCGDTTDSKKKSKGKKSSKKGKVFGRIRRAMSNVSQQSTHSAQSAKQ